MRTMRALHVLALVSICLAGAGRPPSLSLDPPDMAVSVRPERAQPATLSITVDPGEQRQQGLDVLFLFDQTGSMSNVIEAVRDAASNLMDRIGLLAPDVRFGVASFDDYEMYGDTSTPGVWFLHAALGGSRESIRSALSSIEAADGGDGPEAYSRALHEASLLPWRPDARRFVILFGDAPAHDESFYGADLGVDPGRDGEAGTGDDLRLRSVVRHLARDGIRVMAVHDSAGSALAESGFAYIAAGTGGLALPVENASEVPEAILRGMGQLTRARPVLEVPEDYATWVTLGVPERSGEDAPWQVPVSFHPPRGTAFGTFRFPIRASLGAGSPGIGARSDVTLEVAPNPWGYRHVEYWSPWPARQGS